MASSVVGSLQETVLVTGESPLLQTDTSTLSSLVNEQQMQDLPVNGRNFIRLVQLVPGATEGAAKLDAQRQPGPTTGASRRRCRSTAPPTTRTTR